ncbi:PQQ-binding-like beta-propeller repeat protein [Heliobacterium undosum]|uniref:PQQ-binding-like beta-propeller repeat protein n=1 Tax=Heliomicrobium undosum TaxID=121734 RepID=A0A845L506_9FIRM|nr:PQQ-binding-like beta-propeller repeat protein [Heliomicrobium undosum]MZP29730.1 PQQ-binding-like beta-propeller repeat protein [Heliomicrobium undosum]
MRRCFVLFAGAALAALLSVQTAWAATVQWSDGSIFEGDIRGGKIEGPGTLRWSNGTIYKGKFSNSLPHGYGRLQWPNGVFYEGDFQEGTFHGSGALMESASNYYIGEFRANLPHGLGVRGKDGVTDAGLWDQGMPDPNYSRTRQKKTEATFRKGHDTILTGSHALAPVEPFLTQNGWSAKTKDYRFPVLFEKSNSRLLIQADNPIALLNNKPVWLNAPPVFRQGVLYADMGDLLSWSGRPALGSVYYTPQGSEPTTGMPLHSPSRQLLQYGPKKLKTPAAALSAGSHFGAPVVARDGTVYAGTEAGIVYAFGADGKEKWRYDADGAMKTAPVLSQGLILIGSSTQIISLDAEGALRWAHPYKVSKGGLTAAPNGSVWAACDDGVLLRLSASTGIVLNQFTMTNASSFAPVVASDGSVYAGGYDKRLNAFSASGEMKWTFETGGVLYGPPAIGPDGALYVTGLDLNEPVPGARKLYLNALDAATGKEKWRALILGGNQPSGIAVGWNGIYVVTDSQLLALSATGQVLWKTDLTPYTDARIVASTPLIDLNGIIYVNANVPCRDDSAVFAVDPQGKVLATCKINGVMSGPMTLDIYGNLVAGAADLILIQ